MELEPRLKQTEAGLIPEDWIAMPLSGIGSFKNGINKPAEAFGHGSPFINLMDVFGIPRAAETKEKLGLINSTPNEQKAYNLYSGDVLFVRSSVKPEGVGLTTLIPKSLPSTIYSGFLIRFRDHGLLTSDFKQYCFLSHGFRKQVLANSTVSANTNINQNALKQLQVAFPPCRQEQNRIAKVLSEADSLISSLNQLIAKKRDIKHGAMQELLTGKRRLPGFDGEWQVKRLGEICQIRIGRTPSRLDESMWGQGHYWLSIADLKKKVVSESKEQITESAGALMSIVRKGSLLMSFKLSIGRLCFAGCDLFTNEAICSFDRLTENSDYLYYSLGRTDFSLYGKQAVKGYTLNKQSLNIIEVKLPSKDEQFAISNVLSDMDIELAVLEARLKKAQELKQGMMQELLTGKIRLR